MTTPESQNEHGLRAALAAQPRSVEAHARLARFLHLNVRHAESAAIFRAAVAIEPDRDDLHAELGHSLWAMGDAAGALAAYAPAIGKRPNDALIAMNLAHALAALGNRDQALTWMKHAVAINPSDPVLQMNLGVIHYQRGEIDEASTHYARAIELKPDYAEAWVNHGNAALYTGNAATAVKRFDRALTFNPSLEQALGNIVLALSYVPDSGPSEILNRAREWDRRFALTVSSQPRRNGGHPLRIGYVSPDLGNHPIGHFMAGVFANHDTARFPFFVYAQRAVDDPMTQRLQRRAAGWRKTVGMTDEALIEHIRADRIDILVDLAGHTSGNRLRVFTARPAPLQMTWIGSIGTTGVSAMDYVIADRHHMPSGSEANFIERPLRLEQWVCYTAPDYAPPVGKLPAESNGYVTFGCFANPAKINTPLIEVWSEIMRAVPGSKLLLKYRWMDAPANRQRIVAAFADADIDASRILIEGESSHAELLARYGAVDIALDTFPYSGGVTTAEAIWMGVPVVTIPEARFASRHSLSLLSTAGLASLVAEDPAAYRSLAVGLAGDPGALAQRRETLRGQAAASALCDGERFTRALESAYERSWAESKGAPG